MKQITLFILSCLFCLTGMTAQAANTVIKYTADSKLPEVTGTSSKGLHTNAFTKEILSHEFVDGKGTITFNGEITAFGEYAFYYAEVHTFEIPSGITELGKNAMNRSNIDTLIVPKTITKIVGPNFNNAVLRYVSYLGTISDWLQIDFGGNYAATPLFCLQTSNFYINGKLATEIEIPEGVTTINDFQLAYNRTTTKYTLPTSLTTIKAKAFRNNSKLATIICNAVVPPTCGEDVFAAVPTSCTVYVPAESVDAYKAADGWNGLQIVSLEPTGIKDVQGSEFKAQGPAYNLNGIRVNSNYNGVVIMNGKKFYQK